jgi:Transposase.
MEWYHTSPKKKNQKTMPAACKVMGTVIWDAKGCVLVKFLSQGETINAACYLQTLHKLRCALHDICPGKRSSCNTVHSPTPLFYVWKGFKRTPGKLSAIQSGPSRLRQPFVSVF